MLNRRNNPSNRSEKILSVSQELYTYRNCHSSSRIRAFLHLSRLASDDSIKEHLNETPPYKCTEFVQQNLLPHWKARTDLIDYCYGEAATISKNIKSETTTIGASAGTDTKLDQVDLRIDPYAVKDANERTQRVFAECEEIMNWVANERQVDNIVRQHTFDVLNRKCYYHDWLREFKNATKVK
ncbi:hypothetical protein METBISCDRAFT_23140 [Metschnikowia bicuspidata]|uniref:Uncharacterized protein n=1 Tax=Metschnikowia bicuspidata TaxID=27322 RepID=A0A4P9ZCH4_9ASCO|nr:hypothetical protein METBISCDRAFT_23140 [Metschnikowia bicuspidata]